MPDIYDMIRFDVLHNSHLEVRTYMPNVLWLVVSCVLLHPSPARISLAGCAAHRSRIGLLPLDVLHLIMLSCLCSVVSHLAIPCHIMMMSHSFEM